MLIFILVDKLFLISPRHRSHFILFREEVYEVAESAFDMGLEKGDDLINLTE